MIEEKQIAEFTSHDIPGTTITGETSDTHAKPKKMRVYRYAYGIRLSYGLIFYHLWQNIKADLRRRIKCDKK